MGRNSRRACTSRPGTFDPSDRTRVKHTKISVWDLYEEIDPARAHVPGASYAERAFEAHACLPYLARMIRDVLAIWSCWFLLAAYAIAEGGQALLPAASLWYVLRSWQGWGLSLTYVHVHPQKSVGSERGSRHPPRGRYSSGLSALVLDSLPHYLLVPHVQYT